MTIPAAIDLSALPGEAASGGYVYAISFDNGTVKVGSTINPNQRIRFHQTTAIQFDITVLDLWLSPELDDYLKAERRLLAAATRLSGRGLLREWFRGLDFRTLVEIAPIVISYEADFLAPSASTAADPWIRVKEALGVDTNARAAACMGIPLRTAERMFLNPENSLMRNALKARAATGISLDELFPHTSVPDMAEAA